MGDVTDERADPDRSSGPPSRVLAIEVGGTNLRAAIFDPITMTLADRAHAEAAAFTGRDRAAQSELVRTLHELGAEVLGDRRADVVSIAYPGPIDGNGVVLAAPTVHGAAASRPFPLLKECSGVWPHARVLVLNDLTAAGLRYAEEGLEDFCVLTVGSGVGHKVFVDGRPLIGPGGRGGEIGHLRVDDSPGALPCDCGDRGHLGGIASGRGSVQLVRMEAERDDAGFRRSTLGQAVGTPAAVDGPAIAVAFGRADPWVRSAIRTGVEHLGHGIAAIHLSTGVERFVLIGGFAFAMGEEYRRLLVGAVEAACWRIGQDWDDLIGFGIPDDDQGMMGAGLFALREGVGSDRA